MRLLPTLTSSLLACFALLAGALAAPQAVAASPVSCAEIDLPVPVLTPHEIMHGQLCMPAGGAPTTVQLLIPGGTYNRLYWDLPYQPERYSYQRDMASHGYATFAVDRLGTGQSTTPPSAALVLSVDGVILTGTAHLLSALVTANAFATSLHPVTLDPQLRKNGSDPGNRRRRTSARPPSCPPTSCRSQDTS